MPSAVGDRSRMSCRQRPPLASPDYPCQISRQCGVQCGHPGIPRRVEVAARDTSRTRASPAVGRLPCPSVRWAAPNSGPSLAALALVARTSRCVRPSAVGDRTRFTECSASSRNPSLARNPRRGVRGVRAVDPVGCDHVAEGHRHRQARPGGRAESREGHPPASVTNPMGKLLWLGTALFSTPIMHRLPNPVLYPGSRPDWLTRHPPAVVQAGVLASAPRLSVS